MDEQASQLTTIYLNPFKNKLTASFTNSENHFVELFNTLSEQIKLVNLYKQNTVINIDNLSSGVYSLCINDEKLILNY